MASATCTMAILSLLTLKSGGRNACWWLCTRVTAAWASWSLDVLDLFTADVSTWRSFLQRRAIGGVHWAARARLPEFQKRGRANVLGRHALQLLLQGEPGPACHSCLGAESPCPWPPRAWPRTPLPSESAARLEQHWPASQCAESRGVVQHGRVLSMSAKAPSLTLYWKWPVLLWGLSEWWVLFSETWNSSLGRHVAAHIPSELMLADPWPLLHIPVATGKHAQSSPPSDWAGAVGLLLR